MSQAVNAVALPTTARDTQTRVAVGLAITVLTWGSAFAGIRIGLKAYGPGEMGLLRLLFGTATLGIYAVCTRMRLPNLRDLPGIFLLGFLGFGFYYAALNYGEVTTEAGVTSLLIATAPIFTALFATLFLKEHLGRRGLIGVLVASGGVLLIIVGQQKSFGIIPGAMLILCAAISAAAYFSLQRPFLKHYSSLEMTTYSMFAGTLMSLGFGPHLLAQIAKTNWQTTAVVAYLGIFPAALGYVLWNFALSKWPVSRVASFLYLVPVVGLACGWVMLREMARSLSLYGGPVAVAGVYLVNTRKRVAS